MTTITETASIIAEFEAASDFSDGTYGKLIATAITVAYPCHTNQIAADTFRAHCYESEVEFLRAKLGDDVAAIPQYTRR